MSDCLPFKPLRTGSTIGVIALSSPCEEMRFKQGLAAIESFGFKVRLALEPWKYYGKNDCLFSSDSIEARVAAFRELIEDKSVEAILAARGAYGSMELLPYLPIESLKSNPKPVIGFSDVTAVLMAMDAAGVSLPVHGPSVESSFSHMSVCPEAATSAEHLVSFLRGEHDFFESVKLDLVSGENLVVSGQIVGGNLSILASLCGTPWAHKTEGKILFIEESGERPYRVHRMLSQLGLSGVFSRVKGVLLGNFKECVHPKGGGPTDAEVIRRFFGDYKLPVWQGFPGGHCRLNYPLPYFLQFRVGQGRLETVHGG